jgi:type IV pilus assembly protein PilA
MKNKKGFTIVELVIVIAVIGILAAVLIPTFVKLIRKSRINSDQTLIRNLNTALRVDLPNEKHDTLYDALIAAKASGYDVNKINASATNNEILWDSLNDVFCYLNENEIEYLPDLTDSLSEKLTENDYRLWKIYTTAVPSVDDQTYSIYCATKTAADSVSTVKVGVDVGDYNVNSLVYDRSGETSKRDLIKIRTNSYFTEITVKAYENGANCDTISHYGVAAKLNIINAGSTSYHEYGYAGYAEITKGRLVVEENGKIEILVSNSTSDVSFEAKKETGVSHAHALSLADADALNGASVKINWDYDADGTQRHPDGVWDVQEGVDEVLEPRKNTEFAEQHPDYVARIGTTGYNSLSGAMESASEGNTVVLLKDTTEERQIDLFKSFTLDMNGKTLTYNNNYASITLNSGTLTVKGNGIINAQYDMFYLANFMQSSLVIENGTFSGYGNIIENARNGNSITINGGTFNVLSSGKYAVYLKCNTDLTINDCVINATSSYCIMSYPQGNSNKQSTITINGGTFNSYYSVIRSQQRDTITINGGNFSTQNSLGTNQNETCVIALQNSSGNISLTINDGVFTSKEGMSILNAYNAGTKEITINGGTYNYTAENFVKIKNNTGERTYHLAEGYEYCQTEYTGN